MSVNIGRDKEITDGLSTDFRVFLSNRENCMYVHEYTTQLRATENAIAVTQDSWVNVDTKCNTHALIARDVQDTSLFSTHNRI